MLDDTLWPSHRLAAKEATTKLVSSHNLHEAVVLGRTRIFFKSQSPIFLLEAERQKKLPHLVKYILVTVLFYLGQKFWEEEME